MPLKLSELIAQTAKRSFEYAGETVNLEIFTQKVTPAYRSRWEQVSSDPTKESRCQLIADMVAGWDVLGDDDNPQPISYDFLQHCPDGFLNQVVQIVEEVLFPNPTNASNSPSGSQPTTTPQEN
jgi:hypothetical protein